jgi:hypothetical protein
MNTSRYWPPLYFQPDSTRDIVRVRWPSIRKAFVEFDLRLVASWPDTEVDRLLGSPGIIRNRKKVPLCYGMAGISCEGLSDTAAYERI